MSASSPPAFGDRLLSLDAFRGFTMLLLVSHGFGIHAALRGQWALADQFEHAAWVGCTLWDLIQPAFTFIVGVAMPLALGRRTAAGRHVAWRALVLVVLSNVLSNWGTSGALKLQFINVLCQIAFSYVLCYLILRLPGRGQVGAAGAIFALHHGLFFLFPGAAGPFDPVGNYAARVDLAVLGYNYSGNYTTLNFLGNGLTVLFGCWTGLLLQREGTPEGRLRRLVGAGVGALAAGWALGGAIPMVKRLWTGSFLLFSTGWVLLAFAFFYWLVEMRGARRWTFPLVVVGANSIFIYSFSQVLRGWLSRGLAAFDGQQFAFWGPAGGVPHNVLVMLAMWGLCYWLYGRRIFFKI
jgi:predicted acyltransferase